MFCIYCGSKIDDRSAFCVNCGKPQNGQIPTSNTANYNAGQRTEPPMMGHSVGNYYTNYGMSGLQRRAGTVLSPLVKYGLIAIAAVGAISLSIFAITKIINRGPKDMDTGSIILDSSGQYNSATNQSVLGVGNLGLANIYKSPVDIRPDDFTGKFTGKLLKTARETLDFDLAKMDDSMILGTSGILSEADVIDNVTLEYRDIRLVCFELTYYEYMDSNEATFLYEVPVSGYIEPINVLGGESPRAGENLGNGIFYKTVTINHISTSDDWEASPSSLFVQSKLRIDSAVNSFGVSTDDYFRTRTTIYLIENDRIRDHKVVESTDEIQSVIRNALTN